MTRERFFLPSKKKLRNLLQYRDMTDDEFNEFFDKEYGESGELNQILDELDRRVDEKIKELGEDYALEDMKANDMMQLRALVLAILQLDDIENETYFLRQNITESNILVLEKLNRMASTLRTDISNTSADLQLTKKIRSKSKEASVQLRWESLTEKAFEFYKRKMLYLFCPDCKMLLSTVWLMYPDNKTNVIKLKCERCNSTHTISNLYELYEKDNKNVDDIVIP